MRLSSIKLAGFKSFCDPVTLDFPSDRTVLVGPNGCGKSNIIDAIRWVLGESSASGLRSDSMEDVIFNGTENNPPRGRAMVEMQFANDKQRLSGKYKGLDKVSIRRVLERDRDSRYYINDAPCRKKDISEIFAGMGLTGKTDYAIVTQGAVHNIVESKPEHVRSIIEEAADITGYLAKRKETLLHIKHTKDNLRTINSNLSEMRQRVRSLEKQAETAKVYKKNNDELEELKQQLTYSLYNQLVERKHAKREHLNELIENIDKGKNDAALWQTQQQEQSLAEDRIRAELKEQLAKQRELAAKVADIEARNKYHIRQLQEKEFDLDTVNKEMQENNDKLKAQQTKLEAAKIELGKIKQAHGSGLLQAREEIRTLEDELGIANQEWQNLLDAALEINNRHKDSDNQLKRLQDEQAALSARSAEISSKEKQRQDNLMAIDSLQQQQQTMAKQLLQRTDKLQQLQDALTQKLPAAAPAKLQAELAKLQKQLAELRQDLVKNEGLITSKQKFIAKLEAESSEQSQQYKQDQLRAKELNKQIAQANKELQQTTAAKEQYEEQRRIAEQKRKELIDKLRQLKQQLHQGEEQQTQNQERREELLSFVSGSETAITEISRDNVKLEARRQELLRDTLAARNITKTDDEELAQLNQNSKTLSAVIQGLEKQLAQTQGALRELERKLNRGEKELAVLEEKLNNSRGDENQLELELDELEKRIPAEMQNKRIENIGDPQAIKVRIRILERENARIGDVNMLALTDYAAEKEKYDGLLEQEQQITAALQNLHKAIRRIDRESKVKFNSTFKRINTTFGKVFSILTDGGKARLELDAEDESRGVRIIASPPGKRTNLLSLLSGGEKTVTAIAFIMAIFQLNPAPFCLMDEADAMLDDQNVIRFNHMINQMAAESGIQFIVITHSKLSMQEAKHLLGITMSEPGMSRVVSVDMGKALELSEAAAS